MTPDNILINTQKQVEPNPGLKKKSHSTLRHLGKEIFIRQNIEHRLFPQNSYRKQTYRQRILTLPDKRANTISFVCDASSSWYTLKCTICLKMLNFICIEKAWKKSPNTDFSETNPDSHNFKLKQVPSSRMSARLPHNFLQKHCKIAVKAPA